MKSPFSLVKGNLQNSAVLLAGILMASETLRASSIPVVNPGFEDIRGETVIDEFTFGPLNGWNLHDPGGIAASGAGPGFYIGTLTPFVPDPLGHPGVYVGFDDGAAEGSRVGIAFNFASRAGRGEYGLMQTLASSLLPSTTYTLMVEVGNIASARSRRGTFFELSGFPGYRIDLMAGGVVVAQDNNSLAGLIPDGKWGTSTVRFTTGASVPANQSLGIRLVNLNRIDPLHPSSDLEVDFDQVRLDASPAMVPEGQDATLPLLGLGLLMCLRRRTA